MPESPSPSLSLSLSLSAFDLLPLRRVEKSDFFPDPFEEVVGDDVAVGEREREGEEVGVLFLESTNAC